MYIYYSQSNNPFSYNNNIVTTCVVLATIQIQLLFISYRMKLHTNNVILWEIIESYLYFLTERTLPTQTDKKHVSYTRTLHCNIIIITINIIANQYNYCMVQSQRNTNNTVVVNLNVRRLIPSHESCREYRHVHKGLLGESCMRKRISSSFHRFLWQPCRTCSTGTWTWWHLQLNKNIISLITTTIITMIIIVQATRKIKMNMRPAIAMSY